MAQMSPGTASVTSSCVFPPEQVQVPGLDRFPAIADEELRSGGDAALVHAEHGQAPDVGIDLDLENVGDGVLAGVGHCGDLGRLAAAGGHVEINGRVALGRIGQQVDDDIEQLGDAGAGLRRGEHHRDQVPFAHCALERLVQGIGLDLALVEIDLHQLLVHLDHLLDQLPVRFLDRGEVGLARGREKAV